MWNKEELEWLDRNKEIIDSRNYEKILEVIPTSGIMSDRLVIMLTLFCDKEFILMISNIRPKYKLFTVKMYTTLFPTERLLFLIDGLEWIYQGEQPVESEVEMAIERFLETLRIPKVFADEVISKSTLGVK